MRANDVTRFVSAVEPSIEGCWEWQRALDNGYGRFWLDGRSRMAHVVSYEMFVGPIPEGKHIDHLCRNRRCVRPSHLEPVDLVTNVLRGEGLSARNARKDECLHGHPLSGDNLYVTPNGARQCKQCQRARVIAWRQRKAS